ncbi:MAG: hypothetical protein AAFV93_10980 [Chloroflexota bacterium]
MVREALVDLHPHIEVNRKKVKNIYIRQSYTKNFWCTTKGTGIWREKWNFYIHGIGYRLTHLETDERLEWDMGERNSFDKYWFTNWLKWYLYNGQVNPALNFLMEHKDIFHLRELVFPILDSLCDKKELSSETPSSHILILKS